MSTHTRRTDARGYDRPQRVLPDPAPVLRPSRLHRDRLLRRAFTISDVAALVLAFFVSELVDQGRQTPGALGSTTEIWLFLLTLPVWILAARLYGLYDRDLERTHHSTADDAPAVLNMVSVGVWTFYALTRLTRLARPDVTKLLVFWGLAVVALLVFRLLTRLVSRRTAAYIQNAIIVGAGDVGQTVGRKLLQHPEYGIHPLGFVDEEPKRLRGDVSRLSVLGPPARLRELVRRYDVDRVIVAFSREPVEETLDRVRTLTDEPVQVDVVPRLFDVLRPEVDVHTIEGMPLVSLPPARLPAGARAVKRGMDLVGAGLAIVVLSPILAVVAALIHATSDGPVFFRQLRVGEGGRHFRIWKFRTMAPDADTRKHEVAHLNKHLAPGGDPRMFKIVDDPRTTSVGRVLRRYSLDELPQLFNVLSGDMSLVGPRPLIIEEHEFVRDWAQKRLLLRPGMTGLWQVLGRNAIPFDEMVKLDYTYITTWSVWNDCRLLARTVPVVFRAKAS